MDYEELKAIIAKLEKETQIINNDNDEEKYIMLQLEEDLTISVSLRCDTYDGTTEIYCKKRYPATDEGIEMAKKKAKTLMEVICEE